MTKVLQLPDRFPEIICLCGSTKFYREYQIANFELTLSGHIVLSVGFYPHTPDAIHGHEIGIADEDKVRLDELHLRKIDLADSIYVINYNGYIGESTRREIEYAESKGKTINYWQVPPDGCGG